MKVGIISDTHGFLDSAVFEHFKDCDEIWHAGDFGTVDVAQQLQAFKPLRGVFGNIDDDALRNAFSEDLRFDCEESSVWITHIGGRPGKYDRRVAKMLATAAPRLFICGHSHILRIEQDKRYGRMIYLNPGAAGHQGFHVTRTLVTLEFLGKQIGNLKVIELGPRGRTVKRTNSP